MFNPVLLERVFDLRRDGIVILKVLREGPAQCAHALLLLLYGYHQVKKEYVLASELYRSAEQSGISIRGLAKEYARNHRYVVQGGRGKGSNYSLNSEGLATAKEIMATVFERTENAAAKIVDDASFAVRRELSSRTAN
jgi:hypothetical protein